MKQITCVVTSLTSAPGFEESSLGVSSLIDTWFQVRDIELAGERTRGLYLVKSRGMGHSNQVREFVITSNGIQLVPIAVGPGGVLTGSARLNLQAEQRAHAATMQHDAARREHQLEQRLEQKRRVFEAQISAMRAEHETAEEETRAVNATSETRALQEVRDRASPRGSARGRKTMTARTAKRR
jgi:circadian clock protein KaiC